MERNNLPVTSLEAHKSVSLEMRQNHWLRIKQALMVLKLATGEEISVEAKMDYHAVVRRLSEMERLEMIYKPGTKKPTKTGRLAFQYAIRNPETQVPTLERHNSKEISASDYASVIIAKTKGQKLIQKDLFETS